MCMSGYRTKYWIKLTFVVFLSLALHSCKKKKEEPEQYPIPNIPVNVTIYPNDPTNFKIQAVGGWQYYQGAGYQGLIIYRKTLQEFVAIDRASTVNPNNSGAAVKVQSDNFTLKDTVSGATWQIVDGAIMNSSSKWPLRVYGCSYDGNVLLVRN